MLVCGTARAATPPKISSYPAVSQRPVIADGTTVYTVTMTVSDADGYSDIKDVRVMFDYFEAGGVNTNARGYMGWGVSDAQLTKYGGNWVLADATGGYRWGYTSDTWGGTTYITPVSCATTVGGSASGGAGTRTVTWGFKAKAAWASNPLVNDVDCYAADATYSTGWQENPSDFDVVASVCSQYAVAPSAPVVTGVAANSANVAISPSDSSSDLFCIQVSPAIDSKGYIQADGAPGHAAVWQTKSQWGTRAVTRLASSTTYSFSARAAGSTGVVCASAFGPATTTTTATLQHTINAAAAGKAISPYILGDATRLDMSQSTGATAKLWSLLQDVSARGIAGGLDADTYNWKDMSGQGVGHTGTPGAEVPTTLAWMRNIRDHSALPLVTANVRGIGPLASSGYGTFYYTNTSAGTVTALAADWVRYTNYILPTYRQGDTLTASDQAIVDSINWYGRPKLLSTGETATPKVTWWEIGNEPELALPWSTPGVTTYNPTPVEYASRYKQISTAMRVIDPGVKTGPCITTANSENDWLGAVLADPANTVDFISYHPYGPLYGYAQSYGDTTGTAELALKAVRQQQIDTYNGVIAHIDASGRNPADIKLIASEWNVSDWHWEMTSQAARMSHAIGAADTLFAYAGLGLFAAHYWSYPTYPSGIETPGYKLFKEMEQSVGEKLIDSFTDDPTTRVYTTWNSRTHNLAVWALNLSDAADKQVRLSINSIQGVGTITRKTLGMLSGATSLLDYQPNSSTTVIDWKTTDLTGSIDPSDFTVTLPHATISLLVFHQQPSDIPALKAKADGQVVGIDAASISAAFPDSFYIESDDRSVGIRVSLPGHGLSAGTRVSLAGTMGTDADGEREIAAWAAYPCGTGTVLPLGMTNSALGGTPSSQQIGVEPGIGANNIGLLVRMWGKVSSIDRSAGTITLDDGSGTGATCVMPDGSIIPRQWLFASVAGVSSYKKVGDQIRRVVRASRMDDVHVEDADTASILTGRVTDSTNGVLAGVRITVNPGAISAKTEADGTYAVYGAPSGVCSVSAARPGFTGQTATGVVTNLTQITTCDSKLAPTGWTSYLDGSVKPQNSGWLQLASDGGAVLDLGSANWGLRQADDGGGYDKWYRSSILSALTLGCRFRIDSYSGSDIDLMVLSAGGTGATPYVGVGIMNGQLVLKGTANDHVLLELGPVIAGAWNTALLYVDNPTNTVRLEWNGAELYNGVVSDLYNAGGSGSAEFGASNYWGQGGSSTVTFDWVCSGPGSIYPAP